MPLVYGQDERVTSWVSDRLGYTDPPPAYSSIGYERGDRLVAGVFFDGRTETNVFAHIASDATLLPADLLAAVAAFAFKQLGCIRMTFMVHDNNEKCIDLVHGLGAKAESVIVQGHAKGDVMLYVLWRDSWYAGRFYNKLVQMGRADPGKVEE